jgi:hypothetical protein
MAARVHRPPKIIEFDANGIRRQCYQFSKQLQDLYTVVPGNKGIKACLQKTDTCLKRNMLTPVRMANVAAHLEDSNRATRKVMVEATDDDPGTGV